MGFDQSLKKLLKKKMSIDRIKNRIIAAKPYLDSIIDYQFVENLFKKEIKILI